MILFIYLFNILYIKTQCFLFFVCAELIEELGSARNVKFGTEVNNIDFTIKFEDLSEIFTLHT